MKPLQTGSRKLNAAISNNLVFKSTIASMGLSSGLATIHKPATPTP